MAVAVQQFQRPQEFRPEREEKVDPMDQILKGLQIASTVYGIKHNIDQNDLMKAKASSDQLNYGSEQEFRKQQFESEKGFKDQQLDIERQKLKSKSSADLVDDQLKKLDLQKKQGESIAEKKGKTLPPASVESLASSNASLQALEAANKAMQGATVPTGPLMGRVSGLMGAAELGDTGKGAKALDAQLKLNAQTIGKYLEGGKLTDMDIDRYKQMLPNMTDSPQAASEKTKLLLTLISNKQKSEIDGLTQAGYDVGRIKLYTPNMEQAGQQAIQGNPLLPSAQAAPTDLATKAQQILQQRAIKNKGISGIQR